MGGKGPGVIWSGRFPLDVSVSEVTSEGSVKLLLSENEVRSESASCCFITLYLQLFLILVSSTDVHTAVFRIRSDPTVLLRSACS